MYRKNPYNFIYTQYFPDFALWKYFSMHIKEEGMKNIGHDKCWISNIVVVVVFSRQSWKNKTNVITSSLPGILLQLQIFHLDIAEGDQMDKFWANSLKMFCKNENDLQISHRTYTPAPQ